MVRTIVALAWLALVSCHPAGSERERQETQERDELDLVSRTQDRTRRIMNSLAEGRFIPEPSLECVTGWIMTNEAGKSFHRATLDRQAVPLIDLGRHAVPELARWLDHEDMHIRYIAHRALEGITGLEPFFPHFATLQEHATHGWLEESRRAWLGWHEQRR